MPQRGGKKTSNRSINTFEHGRPPVSIIDSRVSAPSQGQSFLQAKTHIWHSPDMMERVGGGGSGGASPPTAAASTAPPIDSPRSFIISSNLSNRTVGTESGPASFGGRPSSLSAASAPFVAQESVTKSTKKKETTDLSPRDYSPPEPTYVCFGCNVAGDHWRAFCPVRPLKGSLPPKARMIMLAAGATPPANLNPPLTKRDTIVSGEVSLNNQSINEGHSFTLQPANRSEGHAFTLQSRGSLVLDNIKNLGLVSSPTKEKRSTSLSTTSIANDDPLLLDLGLGFIATNDAEMNANRIPLSKLSSSLPSSSLTFSTASPVASSATAPPPPPPPSSPPLPPHVPSLNTSLSVSASFRGVETESRGLSSLPPAGIWSDSSMLGQSSSSSSSSSSSFFSASSLFSGAGTSVSLTSTSPSSPEHQGSGSNKSLLPSLPPIPTSISNSVQSLSDKLNWISNGVRFIV